MTDRELTTLVMIIRLAREAHHGGRCRVRTKPGDLVVEISKYDIDPDMIGWLVAHGRAPYERDAAAGAPTREVWDIRPLSGRVSAEGGPVRWENADFVALPDAIAVIARAAFGGRVNCRAVRDRMPCELEAGHDGEHRAGEKRW